MGDINERNKLDEEIKRELEKIRKLTPEDLEKIYGGAEAGGDTRTEYSMDAEDINRSIFGARFFQ